MGGYVGFTKYIYLQSSGDALISPGEPDFSEYYRDADNEFMVKDAIQKISNECVFASEWTIFCPDDMAPEEATAKRQCKMWTDGGKHEEALKAEVGAQ